MGRRNYAAVFVRSNDRRCCRCFYNGTDNRREREELNTKQTVRRRKQESFRRLYYLYKEGKAENEKSGKLGRK